MVSAIVVRSVATAFGALHDLAKVLAALLGLLHTTTRSPAATGLVVCAVCAAACGAACWFREPTVDRSDQGYGPPPGPRTSRGLERDAAEERLDVLWRSG